jgi:hypothetical protein
MTEKSGLDDLRARWAELWSITPHRGIGPTLMQKSIDYKWQERDGGGLTVEQRAQLDQLMKQYKRNPGIFDERCSALKPGTRLIRKWKGKQHSVLVKAHGFEYQDKHYTSLSQIANNITGTRWNGHVFFGLKS